MDTDLSVIHSPFRGEKRRAPDLLEVTRQQPVSLPLLDVEIDFQNKSSPLPDNEQDLNNPAFDDILDDPIQARRLQDSISANLVNVILELPFQLEITESTCFQSKVLPSYSFHTFFHKLVRYTNAFVGDEPGPFSAGIRCSLIAIDYLERARVVTCPKSLNRYFLTALLLALKFTDDADLSLKYFADVVGCTIQELNEMEISFCNLLNWNLNIPVQVFEDKFESVC